MEKRFRAARPGVGGTCCLAAAAANLLSISLHQLSLRPVLQEGPCGKKWRCLFVCNVAVGRAYCTKELQLPAASCPPPGYDSVVGEVSLFRGKERGAEIDRRLALLARLRSEMMARHAHVT